MSFSERIDRLAKVSSGIAAIAWPAVGALILLGVELYLAYRWGTRGDRIAAGLALAVLGIVVPFSFSGGVRDAHIDLFVVRARGAAAAAIAWVILVAGLAALAKWLSLV